ncbi:hypothetical protein DRW03_02355 [Corallococcus sp. H22C18031201]|nr:hypothetical protein DRW03_02355 [Corallococcus sp. H22C18031201]
MPFESADAAREEPPSREPSPDAPREPTAEAASPALADGSHVAGALAVSVEALFRASERALQWAWRVLQLARANTEPPAPGARDIPAEARASVLEFLDHIPPHVRRGVVELLGFCNLWQAVCARLSRVPVRAGDEASWRQLGEDVQLLQRAAQARLGTAFALEQGLLMHLGRLRELCRAEGAASAELRASIESFTRGVSEVMASSSAVRRAWESTAEELSESASWLGAGDPAFIAWLAEHLMTLEPAWRQAHASARWLQEVGGLAGHP